MRLQTKYYKNGQTKIKKNQTEFMAVRNIISKPVDRAKQITQNAKKKKTKQNMRNMRKKLQNKEDKLKGSNIWLPEFQKERMEMMEERKCSMNQQPRIFHNW